MHNKFWATIFALSICANIGAAIYVLDQEGIIDLNFGKAFTDCSDNGLEEAKFDGIEADNSPLTAGEKRLVTVRYRNCTSYTWTDAAGFSLASQNPPLNSTWGSSNFPVSGSVARGDIAVFAFTITAPAAPGTYNFQGQMHQKDYGFFGELMPNFAIEVRSRQAAPAPTIDLRLNGQQQSVTVVAGQTVNATWSTTDAVSCTASGAVSGPVAVSGSASFVATQTASANLRCFNSDGASVLRSVTVNVSPPAKPSVTIRINGSSASPATVDSAVPFTVSWSASNATSCTASGAVVGNVALSGSQSVALTSPAEVRLTCTGSGGQDTASMAVVVRQPTVSIAPDSLPSGTVGTAYTAALTGSGGTSSAYSWSVSAGSLPSGLNISGCSGSTCNITGTPSTSGNYTFTVAASSGVAAGSKQYTITVNLAVNPSITISPDSLPSGVVGTGYSTVLTATGGSGSYIWAVSSGSLPSGILMSGCTGSTCTLTGTPTTASTFGFTVSASSSGATAGSKTYSVTINPQTVQPTLIPSTSFAQFNYYRNDSPSSVQATLTNASSSQSISLNISVPNRPSWLSSSYNTATMAISPLSSMAIPIEINGAGLAAGTYRTNINFSGNFADSPKTIEVTLNVFDTQRFSMTPETLATATVNTPYTATFTAAITGGSGAYTWSVEGSLPLGLSFPSSCSISTCSITGTPTSAGTYSFTLGARQGLSGGTKQYTITVNPASPLYITTETLPNGTVGTPYSQVISTQGATSTGFLWSISPGALPYGLSLVPCTISSCTSSNTVSGTPTTAGTYNFAININSSTQAASKQYAIVISPQASTLDISTTSIPDGRVGSAYSASLTGSGGNTAAYYWTITGLPSGLSHGVTCSGGVCTNVTRSISGNPVSAGTYPISVTLSDGASSVSKSFNLVVSATATVTADIKASNSDGPVTINYNTTVPIAWTSTNASSCAVNPGSYSGISGSVSHGPLTASTTFTVTCTGSAGTATDSVTVSVALANSPTVDLKVNNSNGPVSINSNSSVSVTWTSTNAASCTVSPAGYTGISGSMTYGPLTANATLSISCASSSGTTATDSVSININPEGSVYPDGKLINDGGTIYIIEYGLKRPFTSMAVFNGLGFNLSNVIRASIVQINAGAAITTAAQRHTRGVLVNSDGTIYFMGSGLRYPFPSGEVFLSWGHRFQDVVAANQYDLQVPVGPVVERKQ